MATKTPMYMIYGSRGILIGENNKELKIKYLDPDVELAEIKADPETPESGSSFGNKEPLLWKEETIALSGKDNTDVIWDYFYEAYRNNKPYPITSAQALEVMRVIDEVKKDTIFVK